jgi:phosphate transport system substrate-binding protein
MAVNHVRAFLFLTSAYVFLGLLSPLQASELRVGGTGSATELLKHLGDAFAKHSETRVEVIPSLGSSGAISALGDGVLDLAVSGRSLKPEEQNKGLTVALAMRTPFVIATSHPKPEGLKATDLAGVFSASKPTWADGAPMRPILRPRSESDTILMGALFPGLAAAIEIARNRPDIPVAATDQDNAEMAERLGGSLIASTLTQLLMEKRNLRPVAIDGVEPTFSNFVGGTYPYGKDLRFVVRSNPTPATERFLAFLASPQGQDLLREAAVLR